jgi:CubicO group peptidase (beta-lactamase class C family)
MLNRRAFFCSSAAVLSTAGSAMAAGAPAPGISAALAEAMIDDHGYPCSGMVAGLCDARDHRIVTRGTSDAAGGGRALDGDTVFDIGSITKLFTSVALADMVVRGQMAMNDPLAKHLPATVRVPDYQGRPITLLDLATYSPGLSGWPADMPELGEGPFPDYPPDRLYQALSRAKLDAAPGSKYVYSNFGYGLLGLALAHRAGMDFESLIVSRVCGPLGMESTRMNVTPSMRPRVAPGYTKNLAKIVSWNMPEAFAAAGAFRSTANDLLKFLAAAMGLQRSPLAPAFAELLKVERPAKQPNTSVGAGWFITSAHDDRLVWKDGGVLGYSSFIGYSASHGKGLVVLANGNSGVLNLGKHLLDPAFPTQG